MSRNKMRRATDSMVRRALHFFWQFRRGMTLGVRAEVIDGDGRVFLVKHSYISGWHLPGGGVEPGETVLDALRRELREEGNIELIGPPELDRIAFDPRVSQRDHNALFVVREFRQHDAPVPDYEIVARGFFAPDALPSDTQIGTILNKDVMRSVEPSLARMNRSSVRRAAEPLVRGLLHLSRQFGRGMTLGVRAVVIDRDGKVFLVKHSYVSGWHLPGGGVEPGETVVVALRRELREEGNIEVVGAPQLYGIAFNPRVSRRDHVALFVVRDFRQDNAPVPDHEIVAHGFFAPDALPEETTDITRARIAEVMAGRPVAPRD
jgi:ADP-ribose pyrophosphatase YjhB (NUDIX family)